MNGGIVGCIGRSDRTAETLVQYLDHLMDRPSDTSGVALGGESLDVCHSEADVAALQAADSVKHNRDRLGIGHASCRFRVEEDAVPTTLDVDPAGRVAVVCAGTIDNVDTLRDDRRVNGGCTYRAPSVIPDLIARHIVRGESTERAFCSAVDRLEGHYALAAVAAGEHAIYTAATDVPLAIGSDAGSHLVSSDPDSLRDLVGSVTLMRDGEVAVLWPNDRLIVDA